MNKQRAENNEALQAYIDLYLSDTGLVEVVQQVGYIAIPEADREATRSTWEAERPA